MDYTTERSKEPNEMKISNLIAAELTQFMDFFIFYFKTLVYLPQLKLAKVKLLG